MKIEKTFITRTIQNSSWALLSEAGKDLTINRGGAEDNMSFLLSLLDNLNNLHETLKKLNCLLERKIIEQNLNKENRE